MVTLKPSRGPPEYVVNRFWRRGEKSDEDGHRCPFCESLNQLGAAQCAQCYYEFDKPAMAQPMAAPTTTGADLLDTLMSEIEEEDEEGPAVEVVLTMDDISVDVDQYEVVEQNEEQTETFQFIESASPTLSATVESTTQEEVEIEAKDAIADVEMFESEYDPLAEVAEPVAMSAGKVVSPMKDPGVSLPELPGDELFNDEEEFIPEEKPQVEPITGATFAPEVKTEAPVITEQRFWPWPAGEAWDPRDVHRRVVECLEAVKSGKYEDAAKNLDEVGPHLDGQIELIYHVGLILKSVGRIDSMRWMLAQAARMHPDDSDVKTALVHLGTE